MLIFSKKILIYLIIKNEEKKRYTKMRGDIYKPSEIFDGIFVRVLAEFYAIVKSFLYISCY